MTSVLSCSSELARWSPFGVLGWLVMASLAFVQPSAALGVRGPDGARIVIDARDAHVLVGGEVFVAGLVPGVRRLRAEVEGR